MSKCIQKAQNWIGCAICAFKSVSGELEPELELELDANNTRIAKDVTHRPDARVPSPSELARLFGKLRWSSAFLPHSTIAQVYYYSYLPCETARPYLLFRKELDIKGILIHCPAHAAMPATRKSTVERLDKASSYASSKVYYAHLYLAMIS